MIPRETAHSYGPCVENISAPPTSVHGISRRLAALSRMDFRLGWLGVGDVNGLLASRRRLRTGILFAATQASMPNRCGGSRRVKMATRRMTNPPRLGRLDKSAPIPMRAVTRVVESLEQGGARFRRMRCEEARTLRTKGRLSQSLFLVTGSHQVHVLMEAAPCSIYQTRCNTSTITRSLSLECSSIC